MTLIGLKQFRGSIYSMFSSTNCKILLARTYALFYLMERDKYEFAIYKIYYKHSNFKVKCAFSVSVSHD